MGRAEAEKYEVTREKRIGAISQEERILEAIEKNPYFVIYFVKLFNGGNISALSYHVSTRYKILSPRFQDFLGPSLFS